MTRLRVMKLVPYLHNYSTTPNVTIPHWSSRRD
ncbi:hypothetical protein LINGRAPRIM_LOCUS598 [Linum grandiflorum]